MNTTPLPARRRHDIDALRVFAFALLILYHASGIWQRDSDFVIVSGYQHGWIEWARIALNRWRMPLLFLISGVALSLALRARPQGGWRMFGKRSVRLLLPLVFGMLVVVPVQPYVEAVNRGSIEPGYLRFWWQYVQLRQWPDDAFSAARYGMTWAHLWYLPYLWCYTAVLLALRPLLESRLVRQGMSGWLRLATLPWLLLPGFWLFVCVWWLQPLFPETHALFGDWFAHGLYFACFLCGWLVAPHDGFWRRLRALRWPLLAWAVVFITIELGLRAAGRFLPPHDVPAWAGHVPWGMIERAARALYTCTALLAILGWASTWLDRPFRWLRWANEAVYPCYILHQSVLVVLAYWLIPLQLGPWIEPTLIIAGTFALCLLLFAGIRRMALLRPMFGLPARGIRRSPAADGPRSAGSRHRHASHRA
ncbi:MAG: acyltransferase [Pseudoxanthomonas suwonensis]|nr:acyltransferase [Pseudoxanthomonas suwonensis]